MIGRTPDEFIGGAFTWFTGVVEDIQDPKQMGRVRVRCFGFHTDDKGEIPTESLPWALVMMPVTSASMSTIGQSATGILPGSWVIGFFRDGPSAQDPLVLGTIPSISNHLPAGKGFTDPSGAYPLRNGQIDTPQQATYEYKDAPSWVKREHSRQEKVETAIPPRVSTVAADGSDSYYARPTWSNLETDKIVSPKYPANQVRQSVAGHVEEIDNTPGAARLLDMHTSGTYQEIVNDGSRTVVVRGSQYSVVFQDNNLYVKGNCNITIDGNARQLVKGNYHLEVEGNYTQNIKGSKQTKVGGSEHVEISVDFARNIGGDQKEHITKNTEILREGDKNERIGKNNDLLVYGDDSHLVIGDRSEYAGGKQDDSVAGEHNVSVGGAATTEVAGDALHKSLGNTSIKSMLSSTMTGARGSSLSAGLTGTTGLGVTEGAIALLTPGQVTIDAAAAMTTRVGGVVSTTASLFKVTAGMIKLN